VAVPGVRNAGSPAAVVVRPDVWLVWLVVWLVVVQHAVVRPHLVQPGIEPDAQFSGAYYRRSYHRGAHHRGTVLVRSVAFFGAEFVRGSHAGIVR
jgi:hypothetical protein